MHGEKRRQYNNQRQSFRNIQMMDKIKGKKQASMKLIKNNHFDNPTVCNRFAKDA